MSEPMIIIEPCAGLGNRLLGLGSAYAVAEKLNRRLVVMWKREVGCNIRFSELFDLPFEVVEISENGFKNEPVAQLLGNHAICIPFPAIMRRMSASGLSVSIAICSGV